MIILVGYLSARGGHGVEYSKSNNEVHDRDLFTEFALWVVYAAAKGNSITSDRLESVGTRTDNGPGTVGMGDGGVGSGLGGISDGGDV